MALTAIAIVEGVKRLAPFLGAASLFAAGAGAAIALEHKAPWGLAVRFENYRRDEVARIDAARTAGAQMQAALDAPAFVAWGAALGACRQNRVAERNDAGADLSQARADAQTQSSAAYRLGLAACRRTANAPPPPVAAGQHDPRASDRRPDRADRVPDAGDDLRAITDGAAYAPGRPDRLSPGGAGPANR